MAQARHRRRRVRPAPRVYSPTPIPVSRRARIALLVLGVLALGLVMWFSPTVPIVLLGGFAVALVLSFPVRWLSRIMPRWLAMLVTFVVLGGLVSLALLILVPILIVQLISFVKAVPDAVTSAKQFLRTALQPLADYGLLRGTPDQFIADRLRDVVNLVKSEARDVVGGLVNFVSRTVSLVITLIGVLFVSVYLLANVRNIKATYLMVAPKRYRRDAAALWESEGRSLSRYLSGLGLDMLMQGAISTVFLFLLGVPYALLLGTWVAIAAIIPYLGAWLGAIPAVLVALTVSPLTAILTALAYLVIQQIEGNILLPRIQGQALNMPSILIFLGVIAGGEMFGFLGILFAVPTMAVLKALFDFLRARLYAEEASPAAIPTPQGAQMEGPDTRTTEGGTHQLPR